MPASLFQKVLCLIGIVSLIHSAYSAAQHRSFLRLTEKEFLALPLDIIIQSLASLVVILYSASGIAGQFMQIQADAEMRHKSFESVGNCPSFYIFEHRAKSLSPYFGSHFSDQE